MPRPGRSCCFPGAFPKSCHAAPVQGDALGSPSQDLPLVQHRARDGVRSCPGDAGEPL